MINATSPRSDIKMRFEILLGSLFRPALCCSLLRNLPIVLRGFRYGLDWRPDPDRHNLAEPQGSEGRRDYPNALRMYFDSHLEGRGIWKWNHYFEIYERHFRKFVGRDVHVLEIGVYSGGSLEMWKQYFGSNCFVYGVDINDTCKSYENDYTKIFIGDQANREFWRTFKEQVPTIDILIDDGGHKTHQQIVTLEEMLPYIRPGGVYLCEDVHRVQNGFTGFAQGLVDSLNAMVEKADSEVMPTTFQKSVHSIHFYPYAIVIEKTESSVDEFTAPKHGTEWQPNF